MSGVQRVLRGSAATLRLETLNADGTIAAPGGTVTVGVTTADGTEVLPAGTATGGSAGSYTVAVSAAQTAALGQLQAEWTNGTTTWATKHDVVGGFFFSLAAIRAFDAVLGAGAANPFTDDELLTARQAVEEEAERICDRAFVPRYQRVTVDGSGTGELLVGVNDIRRVRTARVYSSAGSVSYTALGASALAGLVYGQGTVRRTDSDVWDEGTGNVVLEVEYGLDDVLRSDLVTPLLVLLRHRITEPGSDVLDRATAYQPGDGSFSPLDLTAGPYRTGIQLVDAALGRYSLRTQGDGSAGSGGQGGAGMRPASRPLSPQSSWRRNSLFHGR